MLTASESSGSRLLVERLIACAITVVALALLLNGTLFSAWNANHVDLSINLTAAHVLRDGDNPYDVDRLRSEAEQNHSPTNLIYGPLFTTYIQPPTSAMTLLPLTLLDWRDATHLYLILNHIFLFVAVALTLYTIRPSTSLRWTIAITSIVLLLYQQLNTSFALGQVDAPILLLLSIALWAYTRGNERVTGGAIALGVAIKLLPIALLLYFAWKREWRVVGWGVGVGIALLLVSLAYAPDAYNSYIGTTLPKVLEGSTHYSNASFGAVIARANTPETIARLPEVLYLGEVPSSTWMRIASAIVGLSVLAALAIVIPRRAARDVTRVLPEFFLVVAGVLMISSVTWEFYSIWLLPAFLFAALAAQRLQIGNARWLLLAAFAVALIALNFPGDCASSRDCYLFEPNGTFYHPGAVLGVRAERLVGLYKHHLDAVLFLRLPALMLVAGTLAVVVWLQRRDVSEA